MESGSEVEDFKRKSVLAICQAGSDRSQYISEELNKRGYIASNAGVIQSQNYVTKEDLYGIGSIIFASKFEKDIFDKDINLREYAKNKNISIYVMDITESDKNRAKYAKTENELRARIAVELDSFGFKDLAQR